MTSVTSLSQKTGLWARSSAQRVPARFGCVLANWDGRGHSHLLAIARVVRPHLATLIACPSALPCARRAHREADRLLPHAFFLGQMGMAMASRILERHEGTKARRHAGRGGKRRELGIANCKLQIANLKALHLRPFVPSCLRAFVPLSRPICNPQSIRLLAILTFVLVSTLRAIADDSATAPTTAPSAQAEVAPVVVTANRVPTPASEVGSSVSVITSEDLDHEQVPLVSDALRYVPSVNVTRSGGPGQITSVFTRGADSDHTLVLIDGIQANDPTSPTGAFDFSTLTVNDIDQIEVIRGPQSTLWGSNAIGGVINIITKRGEGPLGGYLYTEDGSFNTYREGLGVSGGNKTVNYSLSLSQQDCSRGSPPPTPSSAIPSRTATTSAPRPSGSVGTSVISSTSTSCAATSTPTSPSTMEEGRARTIPSVNSATTKPSSASSRT